MPIQLLPPQLANQIAAGEVVERPAAVVKELVENSLDAGATRIDIEIERGGSKLIRIRDNGCGIDKVELSLALARHATSKIISLEDLQAIQSMGFRGEALASISSVSRLTLTSRTTCQPEAWQVYTEGRDMVTTIKPAAHPAGSTVEVLDLFYNTPARRKFMRTEKTEFGHIDEVIRRLALARFDVNINLHHNGKIIHQYRAATQDESQHQRRLASICGPAFLQHALSVNWQHSDLAITGWVAAPAATRILSEIQYFYVNRRMIRDRLINHAIRQAYQDQLKDDQQPAYVLYLEIDPHQVDVNVHPAKHEVRFHQARLVHDFIYQAVTAVLKQLAEPTLRIGQNAQIDSTHWQPDNRLAAGGNKYAQPQSSKKDSPLAAATVVANRSTSIVAREKNSPTYHSDRPLQKQHVELYHQLLQLQETTNTETLQVANKVQQPKKTSLQNARYSFGRVLIIYPPCYALIEYHDGVALLALPVAERFLKQTQLTPSATGLRPQPLLIPLKLTLNKAEVAAFTRHHNLLTIMGIDLVIEHARAMLRAVPLPLRQQNLHKLIPELLSYLSQHQDMSPEVFAAWVASQLDVERGVWNLPQTIQLLTDVERLCPQLVKSPPTGLLQPIDIQSVVTILKNERI